MAFVDDDDLSLNDKGRPGKDDEDLKKVHSLGVRFFQEGHRKDAIPYLEQSLVHPDPDVHIEAAVLLGETYRGMGDFPKARYYYELALPGSKKLRYYGIRAQFGLITVLRRTLSDDHTYIRRLIQEARNWTVEPRWLDLPAQTEAAEGLFLRQLGEVEQAADRVRRGVELIADKSRPFVLLHPEHMEAMLVLGYLCIPGSAARVARHARQVLQTKGLPWSTAIAAGAMLRIRLARFASRLAEGEPIDVAAARPEMEGFLDELDHSARREGDPFLLSDAKLLRIAWGVLARDGVDLHGLCEELAATLDGAPAPIVLLRAVELGALASEIAEAGGPPPGVGRLAADGLARLDALRDRLSAFQMSPADIDACAGLIAGGRRPDRPLGHWDWEPVRKLRCRAWP